MDLQAIYTGWKNWLSEENLPEPVKEMAERRTDICLTAANGNPCEHLQPSVFIRWIEIFAGGLSRKERKETDGFKCGRCGCGFHQKLLTPEASCPIEKWKNETL